MLVGQGPELDNIKKLIKSLDIEQKVHFLGKSKRIEQITCISDLFLLPSEKESFGLVALEAMASAVPIISSDVGGLPEVNKDGYTGYLLQVGDIDGMVSKSLKILQDKDTLSRFKENALTHSKQFELEKVIPLYEALYNSLL